MFGSDCVSLRFEYCMSRLHFLERDGGRTFWTFPSNVFLAVPRIIHINVMIHALYNQRETVSQNIQSLQGYKYVLLFVFVLIVSFLFWNIFPFLKWLFNIIHEHHTLHTCIKVQGQSYKTRHKVNKEKKGKKNTCWYFRLNMF